MRAVSSALVVVATAASSPGQDCLWRDLGVQSPGGTLLYDSVNSRILSVHSGAIGVVRTWTGAQWISVPTVGAPMHGGPVVFDSTRGRVVQCGGGGGTVYYNDTWEWDGLTWTLVSTEGPAGTDSLVFDEARQRVIRFHQVSGAGLPGQTWVWDGSAWTMTAWAGPESGYFPMVYDPTRQRVMLFGRVRVGGREVWEWDGTAWTRAGDAPETMLAGQAVYDRARERILLHAGAGSFPTTLGRTWEFNPSTGTYDLRATGGPPAGQLVYDVSRDRSLLSRMWEWNGSGTLIPVYLVQQPSSLQLYPGQTAEFSVMVNTNAPATYQWLFQNVPLSNGGRISGADTATLRIDPVMLEDIGGYHVTVTTPCNGVASDAASLFVAGGPCYANCDGNTALPLLTANDFMCFLNRFVAGDPYVNCDGSTSVPMVTAGDFQCFINKYAAGCN